MKTYQMEYSDINPSLFDDRLRMIKAKKIFLILKDFSKKDFKICRCLEVGCSTGMNINFLADLFGECFGIDIDNNAVNYGFLHRKPNVNFIVGDATQLPFPDNFFDAVVCNHVYEHVPDSRELMQEVFRVLKYEGFCYFAAGNKYSVIEGHYNLPFLSWLPLSVSNFYLKATKKGTVYYEKHLSYFQLKRLTREFIVTDYTIKVIREPERFGADDMIRSDSLISKVPVFLLKGLLPLIPTYIFLMTKSQKNKKMPDEISKNSRSDEI